MTRPYVVILAGPNGAGKSTAAEVLLRDTLGIRHFVNADTLARGLSAFASEEWAIKAGKIMLDHLHELADQRCDFAFETTLASRTFAPWIETLKGRGYHFHLIYLYLPTADLAVQRVRDRVGGGGHHVPEDTVRRRYRRGLHNFFALYRPIADYWQFFDNSAPQRPRPIAEGRGTMGMVHDQSFWALAQKEASQ
jgi:predicted ABC-type ATPase